MKHLVTYFLAMALALAGCAQIEDPPGTYEKAVEEYGWFSSGGVSSGGGNGGDGSSSSSFYAASSSSGNPTQPSSSGVGGSTFKDARDGKIYKVVQIGTQIWMAENLSFNAEGSKYYGNDSAANVKYGRLYDWETAMTVCPSGSGWRLPTKEEWETLSSYVKASNGCESCDAKHLKAKEGWNWSSSELGGVIENLDTYGFAALPGGFSTFNFSGMDEFGEWWSASQTDTWFAYYRHMTYNNDSASWGIYDKSSSLLSIRCIYDASVRPSSSSQQAPSSSSLPPPSSSSARSSSSNGNSTQSSSSGGNGGASSSSVRVPDGNCTTSLGVCMTLDASACYFGGGIVGDCYNNVQPPPPQSSSSQGSSSSAVQSSSSALVEYSSSQGNNVLHDIRDNSTYQIVKIGTQTWMAENLNYNAEGSKYYGNDSAANVKYGRLYDWATAMDISSVYNSSYYYPSGKHKGICPQGWHLPSDDEWSTLYNYVGGSSVAGKHLKATTGWSNCSASGSSYSCLDTYGFAALPGGGGNSDGDFGDAGNYGYWWSASESNADDAYGRNMGYYDENANWYNYNKTDLFSVRCLQD